MTKRLSKIKIYFSQSIFSIPPAGLFSIPCGAVLNSPARLFSIPLRGFSQFPAGLLTINVFYSFSLKWLNLTGTHEQRI
jgi:hypothetical protein